MAFGTPVIETNTNLKGGPKLITGTVSGLTGDTALSIDLSLHVSEIKHANLLVSGVSTSLTAIDYTTLASTLAATLPLNSDVISHEGSVDLSSGHAWSSNQDFSINVNGAGATTVTLNTDCANLAAVIVEINAELGTAGVTGVEAYDAGSNHVGIRTTSANPNQSIILAAGGTDALATLGWTAATYSNPSSAISVHFTALGR